MVQPFSYWHSVWNFNVSVMSILMRTLILCLFLMPGVIYGQTQAQAKIKKDVVSVQNAANAVIAEAIPGWGVLQVAKAAYLEGYGVVVTAEVAFDSPLNPFSGQKTPDEVRRATAQKRTEILEKFTNVLKQKVPLLESIAPTESVALILNILNTNPVYTPDIPSQIKIGRASCRERV